MEQALPPLVPFPESAAWRRQIPAADWAAFVAAWLALVRARLALPDAGFAALLAKDESLPVFLAGVVRALAVSGPAALGDPGPGLPPLPPLKRAVFLLTARALTTPTAPPSLLQWTFLADVSRVYGKHRTGAVLAKLPPAAVETAEASLAALKKQLVQAMEPQARPGQKKKQKQKQAVPSIVDTPIEPTLQRINYLVAAWPAAAALLLAGSDYLDALLRCFALASPSLRRCIVASLYLGLVGLTAGPTPRFSLLSDLLYALRGAAQDHQSDGASRADNSLVAELVTATPVVQQLRQRAEAAGTATSRILPTLKDLEAFRKAGSGTGLSLPPGRRIKRKPAADKGKGVATAALGARDVGDGQLHAHRLSQISQIQDLFPDLGSAFVARLLDEYGDDSEQVIAHLLEDTLPPHLAAADRTENLPGALPDTRHAALAPHATPPLRPQRRNIFDGDGLDELDDVALATAKLHFGKHEAATTADDVLRDRASAPNVAAILSALAAFDSDDDERDDTYDAADVGGTVDAPSSMGAGAGGDDLYEASEEALFAAYQAAPQLFARDSSTRRSAERARLRDDTGMTDEAVEGWALMLARNPQRRRRLEMRFSAATAFGGTQSEVARTSWRASDHDGDGEGGGEEGSSAAPRGGHGRGPRGRGGGGRGRGNVAGPTGEKETEQARRRKEAHKGSRANHNRRDQRARKMARGGFPG